MVEKRDESEEVLRDMAGIEDTTEPMNLVKKEPNVEKTPPASSSVSLSSSHLPSRPYKHPEVKLSSLLAQAERLFFLYPPTHPELSLSSIMGPQSVVYTWSESFSTLPTDTEAEAMVSQPGLIVYPYIEEDEVIEDTDDANDEKWEKPPPGSSKRKRLRGKLKGKVKNKLKSFRRVRVDQKTGMVAGAIIVLGVAMAVYGVKMHDRHSGPGLGLGGGVLDVHGRDWRKVAGWLGGAVAGVTERVVNGLSPSMPRGG
ncbi:hypothetical protein H0H87_007354 [Tephrocybe sp. NHM501043]|nr:hypothetical protein H0H87_007354 [Tephrocybe sp. NHM501043]